VLAAVICCYSTARRYFLFAATQLHMPLNPAAHAIDRTQLHTPAAFEAPLPRGLATQTPRPDRVWLNANARRPRSAGGDHPSGTDTKRVAEQRYRHEPRGRCSLTGYDRNPRLPQMLPYHRRREGGGGKFSRLHRLGQCKPHAVTPGSITPASVRVQVKAAPSRRDRRSRARPAAALAAPHSRRGPC
jgi:hypothetical protein